MGTSGSAGLIASVAPALRTGALKSTSFALIVRSSPAASTAEVMLCVPFRLTTSVAPPREPDVPPLPTSTASVVSTETLARVLLEATTLAASAKIASGL